MDRPATLLEERDDGGRLLGRTEVRDGVPHGRLQRFWPEGALQLEADYRAGALHGLLTLFDPDGATVQTAEYQDGQIGRAHV